MPGLDPGIQSRDWIAFSCPAFAFCFQAVGSNLAMTSKWPKVCLNERQSYLSKLA